MLTLSAPTWPLFEDDLDNGATVLDKRAKREEAEVLTRL